MLSSPESSISVVISARNGGDDFYGCLAGFAQLSPVPSKIIVAIDRYSIDRQNLISFVGHSPNRTDPPRSTIY